MNVEDWQSCGAQVLRSRGARPWSLLMCQHAGRAMHTCMMTGRHLLCLAASGLLVPVACVNILPAERA